MYKLLFMRIEMTETNGLTATRNINERVQVDEFHQIFSIIGSVEIMMR